MSENTKQEPEKMAESGSPCSGGYAAGDEAYHIRTTEGVTLCTHPLTVSEFRARAADQLHAHIEWMRRVFPWLKEGAA